MQSIRRRHRRGVRERNREAAGRRRSGGHLVFAIATTVYILIALQIEEHDLMNMHGDAYKDYQRQVSMLIPLPRKK
jgi:hypothetical protein